MSTAMQMVDRRGRQLSARRVERREKILSITLRLIAAKGYERVTVGELAAECGVSKKTLYDIYGSKEEVVAASVSSRMLAVMGRIERSVRGRGIAKLLDIISMTVEAVLEVPTLSRALGPLLIRDAAKFKITHFFERVHGVAIEEMRADGVLVDWADVDFTIRSLMLDQLSVQNIWATDNIPTPQYEGFALLSACRVMIPMVTPAVQSFLFDEVRRLQRDLAGDEATFAPSARPQN